MALAFPFHYVSRVSEMASNALATALCSAKEATGFGSGFGHAYSGDRHREHVGDVEGGVVAKW